MNAVIKKSRVGARWRLGGAVLVVAAAFGLGGAGIALGSPPPKCEKKSSASNQYCDPTVVVGQSSGNAGGGSFTPPSKSSAAGGALPFTGVSLIWPAIAAIALVSLGLGLRRHERKNG